MSAKITLGKPPVSIKRIVDFPLPSGEVASVECEFKYRTKREFGQMMDDAMKAQTEQPIAAERTVAEVLTANIEADADYLEQVLLGWNLDEPFSRDALEQLCDEIPAAPRAILEAYRAAIVEGRSGN